MRADFERQISFHSPGRTMCEVRKPALGEPHSAAPISSLRRRSDFCSTEVLQSENGHDDQSTRTPQRQR